MAPSSSSRLKRSRTSSSMSQCGSQAPQKTEISINVYDLLPPGRLSSFLWTVGGSLLHSGVVIRGREYAYGGHNKRNTTGVYWTKPRFEPPGASFRLSILQGFTFKTSAEVDAVILEVSEQFLGGSYNLLTNNCNHFTNALCEKLTGKSAPAWLNRAASIGLAMPCMVPREWINPPDHDTADGDLLDEDEEEEEEEGEAAAMLQSDMRRRQREEERQREDSEPTRADGYDETEEGNSVAGGKKIPRPAGTPPPRLVSIRDTGGRDMPAAERAPIPKWTAT